MEEKINKIIFEVIDEINFLLEDQNKIEKKENEIIFGHVSKLDSLGRVNFIVILEDKISNEFNLDEFSLIDIIEDHDSLSIQKLSESINNFLSNNISEKNI